MKKIIYISLCIMMSTNNSKITPIETTEPFDHELPVTKQEESIKEKEAQKEKIEAQKQGEINNLNRLFGKFNKEKGLKDRKAINTEIQKITGSDIQLDPNSPRFQDEKKALKKATLDKYNERIDKISQEIKSAQEATDTVAQDFEKSFSDNGLSDNDFPDNETTPLSPIEIKRIIKTYQNMSTEFERALTNPDILKDQLDNNQGFSNEIDHLSNPSTQAASDLEKFLKQSPDSQNLINKVKKDADILNAINQVKTSLEIIAKNPKNQKAFIDRNDAVRNLENLTDITIAGNNGVVENLKDLNLNNLEDVYQEVAKTYKKDISTQETRNDEIEANKQTLNQVTSIIKELESPKTLTSDEIKNLAENIKNVNDSLSAKPKGISSKFIKAINDLIASLRAFLDKIFASNYNLKADLSQNQKIDELKDLLKNLEKNLKSKESAK